MFDDSESEADLDRALRNIRQLMISKNLKLKTVSVQMIDQIYLFSTLNDFAADKTLEDTIKAEMERIRFSDLKTNRRDRRRNRLGSTDEPQQDAK